MFKNVASQKLIVFAFDATTNVPKTGDAANLTAYVSIDYGSVTVLGDTSATEMDATNAPGYYLFDLTQAETNGKTLLFSGKSSTANVKLIGSPPTVFTRPVNADVLSVDSNGRLDIIKVAGTTQTARDIGASVIAASVTGLTVAAIVNGVWDELLGLHSGGSGSMAEALDAASQGDLSGATINDIADRVWEELIADHSGTSGSTAEALSAAGSGADPTTITKVDELHQLAGLQVPKPMTVTPTLRTVGTISQTLSGDGTTTKTVTRTA